MKVCKIVYLLLCVVMLDFFVGSFALFSSDPKEPNHTLYPVKLKHTQVLSLSTGGYTTALIMQNCSTPSGDSCSKEVYWWGLGLDVQKLQFPTSIVELSCGGYHCIGLSEEGLVYHWGHVEGQGGNRIDTPLLIEQLSKEKIKHISAGFQHNVAITEDGKIYSWGESSRGKLGRTREDSLERREPPSLVTLLEDSKFQSACAGGDHTIFLDESGRVFSVGANADGQLGLGHNLDTDTPELIVSLSDEKIQNISCGGDHSLALTVNGDVYSWGWGELGQLGHGDTQNHNIPHKIPFSEKITAIAAGGYGHSYFVTENGFVWGMGWGETYQTGMNRNTLKPARIFGVSRVMNIPSGGFRHSAALTTNGEVFVWGDNSYGQLGNIHTNFHSVTDSDNRQTVEESFERIVPIEDVFSVLSGDVSGDVSNNIFIYGNITLQNSDLEPYIGISSIKNRRNYQEDTAVYVNHFLPMETSSPHHSLFVGVYDGHGGPEISTYLAKNLHQTLVSLWNTDHNRTSWEDTYELTEKIIKSRGFNIPSEHVGSTAVTCVVVKVDECYLQCANIGDSLAYLINTDGTYVELSSEHRPNKNLAETQRIKEMGGVVARNRVNGMLAVSRSFGDNFFGDLISTSPHIFSSRITPSNKWLVLGSDGLWDGITPQQAASLLSNHNGQTTQELANRLLQEAEKVENNNDNITVILFNLEHYLNTIK